MYGDLHNIRKYINEHNVAISAIKPHCNCSNCDLMTIYYYNLDEEVI